VGLYGRAVVAWFILLVLMFGSGTLRVLVLQPRLGEEVARRVASLVGVAIVMAFARAFVARAGAARGSELLAVGLLWTALTLAFEFPFGHYVSGLSWSALLADYDLTRGRLWPLVLVATALGPWMWGRLRPTA
jgi:hypothetical protein